MISKQLSRSRQAKKKEKQALNDHVPTMGGPASECGVTIKMCSTKDQHPKTKDLSFVNESGNLKACHASLLMNKQAQIISACGWPIILYQ